MNEMKNEFNQQDYLSWYGQKAVLFEIVKFMKGREVVFLGNELNVRCIKAHYVDILMNNMKTFGWEKGLNMYVSVAKVENMPMFSYNFTTRKEQQKDFNTTFNNFMTGYDFFLDIDGKDG